MRIRSDEHKARHREEMRRYRAAALAAGLCTSCTAHPARAGKRTCVYCADRFASANIKNRPSHKTGVAQAELRAYLDGWQKREPSTSDHAVHRHNGAPIFQ